jgi:surfeit locus 1 family protein
MSWRGRFALPILLVLVALICARLGVWQVHRLRGRRAANRIALAARAAPVVELRSAGGSADLTGRRIRATGRYDRAHEIILRGVTFEGSPGVQVVTPLRLTDGGAVLVKRGFVPAPDAVSAQLAGLDEPGAVTVTGLALPIERSGSGAPLTRNGRTTWARLNLSELRALLPYPIAASYILQTPDSSLPSLPRRISEPALDNGPHLSYAIQWFAFALTALTVAGILAFRSTVPAEDHRVPR